MKITEQMIKDKLKEIDAFEEKYGECVESRAMRKYCTDQKYRERVREFNKTSIRMVKNSFRL